MKYGDWKSEKNVVSSFEPSERELYVDYSEISPWNTCYMNRLKRVTKPTWKYLSGTMVDFHLLVLPYPILSVFFAFFRALSMWLGISNPFLGICIFISMCIGCWPYGLIYVSWCVILMMAWSYFLGVPSELIKNGLYPSQGVLLGFLVYASNGASNADQQGQLYQLAVLIPVTLLTLFLFQALGNFFVGVMRVTPMFLAPAIIGYAFTTVKVQSTYLFNSFDTHFVAPTGINSTHQKFFVYCNGDEGCSISGEQLGTDVYQGISHLVFSDHWGAVIPITIGLFVTSPVACVTSWLGALLGTVSAILISPLWSTVAAHQLIFPCVITMSSVSGLYFVLSFHSVLMGIISCFLTIFLSIALNSYFEVFELYSSSPIAAYIVVILLYIASDSFESMNRVDLYSVTTPEDHIRRFLLSKKIIFDLRVHSTEVSLRKVKNLENSILPILLCAYAKNGFIDEIVELLDLGADPNACDYDGRCALHIACSENRVDLFKLLLKKQADVNLVDNFDNNALSSALLAGHYDLAKLVYKHGGRLRLKMSIIASMMCYMVAYDDLERLKVWLECGADPNVSDYDLRTPLHIAQSKKNERIIKFLSKYAPRKEKLDRWGKRPSECFGKTVHNLQTVKDHKNLKRAFTADLMRRRYQARPTVRHSMDIDPVILESIIRQMLRGKDTKKSQSLLPSLICELVYIGAHDLLDVLIKENVVINLNISDYDNRTPLHIACAQGNLDMVKTLFWNGANKNAIDRFGNSPLLEACKSKNERICNFLLDQEASLCLPKERQVSELCWFVFNNDFDEIELLVKAGIDIHAGDYDGRTCLAVAYDNDNKAMMEMLRKYIDYSSYSSSSGSSSSSSDDEGPTKEQPPTSAPNGAQLQDCKVDIPEVEDPAV